MKLKSPIKTILISRTDSIGDVVLTLPLCTYLKQQFKDIRILFLGNTYTEPVISCLNEIDEMIAWKEIEQLSEQEQLSFFKAKQIDTVIHVFPKKEIARLMKKVGIANRIGTSHRLFHWTTCNIRPNFTRKNSPLHEAQLNFELLRPLGLSSLPSLEELTSWLSTSFKAKQVDLPLEFASIQNAIILHPKSQGSAIEWPIEKYIHLANDLLAQGKQVVFSGTEKEGLLFRDLIPKNVNCYDLTGKLSLEQFIYFISKQEALVACSTGPYHLAGVLGIKAIGLFSSRKPIHPGRWKALGPNTFALEYDSTCTACGKGEKCHCIQQISVDQVNTFLK